MSRRLADRYLKVLEWSEEDQCCTGAVPGLIQPDLYKNLAIKAQPKGESRNRFIYEQLEEVK